MSFKNAIDMEMGVKKQSEVNIDSRCKARK